jgi:hypothetical protein
LGCIRSHSNLYGFLHQERSAERWTDGRRSARISAVPGHLIALTLPNGSEGEPRFFLVLDVHHVPASGLHGPLYPFFHGLSCMLGIRYQYSWFE